MWNDVTLTTLTLCLKVKWGASSRWSFGPNSAWGSIKTTTARKKHYWFPLSDNYYNNTGSFFCKRDVCPTLFFLDCFNLRFFIRGWIDQIKNLFFKTTFKNKPQPWNHFASIKKILFPVDIEVKILPQVKTLKNYESVKFSKVLLKVQ